VHRDIKPGNVFLTRDGKVKLLDFGLVQSEPEKRSRDTEALKVTGTVEYMAPEQAAGDAVDHRADLYAVGAVLYELLTGRLPHVAPNALALIDRKLRTTPESPRERAPGRNIPKGLDQVVMKALSRYAEQRYKSATEMRMALDGALLAPVRQRKFRRIIAAAVLASTAMVAAVFTVKVSHDPAVRARAAALLGPTAHKMGLSPAIEAANAEVSVDPPIATLYEAPPDTEHTVASHPATAMDGKENSVARGPAEQATAAPSEDEDGADSPEGATPNTGPGPSDAEPESPEGAASLESALARAGHYAKKNMTLQALNAYRKLGARHPDDTRVLRGWSEAAVKTKGWGEALRVAVRWAQIDPSPEAQLYLAKIQRSAGQRYGALATLTRLLEQHPDIAEAHDLLDKYADNRKLASR
jgi:serine/threonine-protein kinase